MAIGIVFYSISSSYFWCSALSRETISLCLNREKLSGVQHDKLIIDYGLNNSGVIAGVDGAAVLSGVFLAATAVHHDGRRNDNGIGGCSSCGGGGCSGCGGCGGGD